MSSEDRLKRLGLWHLRDDPEALVKELARRQEEEEAKDAQAEQEMAEIRKQHEQVNKDDASRP